MTQTITGFGRDAWCGAEGLQTGRFASGVTLLAQALYRRLITPRGTLRGGDAEAAYGIDLAEYVGAVGYLTAILTLPGVVQAELAKDERVLSVVVAPPTYEADSAGLVHITLSVEVTPADESESFTMVMDVSAAAVRLLEAA